MGGLICGLDEAGRGPLAGPVCAAAVILDSANPISGLADSKKVSEPRRRMLEGAIKARALSWAIGWASVEEIDAINILQASLLAMRRAFDGLSLVPSRALVDGLHCPELPCVSEAIVEGDALVDCISAASILAKTARDATMMTLHDQYPAYGFDRHKGYPTRAHLAVIEQFGVCSAHRRSFGPVRRRLGMGGGS